MKEKKCPKKQGQSSFLRTQFVLVYEDIFVYEDNLGLQTRPPTGKWSMIIIDAYI